MSHRALMLCAQVAIPPLRPSDGVLIGLWLSCCTCGAANARDGRKVGVGRRIIACPVNLVAIAVAKQWLMTVIEKRGIDTDLESRAQQCMTAVCAPPCNLFRHAR